MPKPAEVTLPSDREVRVTRTFDVSRQLVWDAHISPSSCGSGRATTAGTCRCATWTSASAENTAGTGRAAKTASSSASSAPHRSRSPSKITHEQYYDPGIRPAISTSPCPAAIPASCHSNSASTTVSRRWSAHDVRVEGSARQRRFHRHDRRHGVQLLPPRHLFAGRQSAAT